MDHGCRRQIQFVFVIGVYKEHARSMTRSMLIPSPLRLFPPVLAAEDAFGSRLRSNAQIVATRSPCTTRSLSGARRSGETCIVPTRLVRFHLPHMSRLIIGRFWINQTQIINSLFPSGPRAFHCSPFSPSVSADLCESHPGYMYSNASLAATSASPT